MTTTPAQGIPEERPQVRPFSSVFLSPSGGGVRKRRGSDITKLVLASFLALMLVLVFTSHEEIQKTIIDAFYPPRHGFDLLITTLWALATVGTVVLMVAVAALSRRVEILRDLLVSVALAMATSYLCQEIFGVTGNLPSSAAKSLKGVNLGFPVPIYAASVALVLVALPYLSRSFQRVLEGILLIGLLSGLCHGAGLPVSLIGSIVIGWAAATGTHLIFGSPTGLASPADVTKNIQSLDVEVRDLVPATNQEWGLERYVAKSAAGEDLRISIYGRDAQESQLFAKLYRAVFLRSDSRPFLLTRAGQVDHECYLTLLADSATTSEMETVIASGPAGPDGDTVVVSRIPSGNSFGELVDEQSKPSDAALASLCQLLLSLQKQKFVHGSIDLDRIIVHGNQATVIDFDQAQNYATPEAMSREVAAALVAMAIAVGSTKTIDIAVKELGSDQLTNALPYLQDVAIPASLANQVRKGHHKPLLKELRDQGAKAAGVDVPKLAELHRVSWTNMILAVGTLIGGWALIGVFLHVAQVASTLKSADWIWVVIVALISQVAYFGSGLATLGSVTTVIPYLQVVILELSNTFSGLALGAPAVLAARIRFFQKQGVDTTIAVSSGVLTSTASWIVKGVLFLISIPFALSVIHFSSLTGGSTGSDQKILEIGVIVVVGIGVIVAASFAIPRWRKLVKAQVVPRLKEVVEHFNVLIHLPRKMAEIFGGMFIAQITMALALGGALEAFGHHLSIPVLLFVLTVGSILGGISPVPGGMGVVEAGMILGLKAAGIPADVAVAAVFVQRLFTAYLPPIAGWFALMWLRRKDYL